MKTGIFTYVLLTILIVMVGPEIIHFIFGVPKDFFENTLVIGSTWLVFGTVIGYGVLVTSLGKEMKQPEMWLHSPAPLLQLVGVKALFATFVTANLLLLNGILIVLSFLFSDRVGKVDLMDELLALLSVIIALFLISIFIMAIGFFFWAVYHVIRSYLGEFSIVLTFALFIGAAMLWEKLRALGLFDAVGTFFPIKATSTMLYNESNSYFFTGIVPGGVITSLGSLLVYGTLTVVLFVVGAALFEKKVRL